MDFNIFVKFNQYIIKRITKIIMKCPSVLLSSIEAMKYKLKCDKKLLHQIKVDFKSKQKHNQNYNEHKQNKGFVKQNNEQSYESVHYKQNNDNNESIFTDSSIGFKRNNHFPQQNRQVNTLKKKHQHQILNLKQFHRIQLQNKQYQYLQKLNLQTFNLKQQLKQQSQYIKLLQQYSKEQQQPIQKHRFQQKSTQSQQKYFQRRLQQSQQYEKIINQLLQENTILIDKIQQMRQIKKIDNSYISCRSDRLRFNKSKDTKRSRDESSSRNSICSRHQSWQSRDRSLNRSNACKQNILESNILSNNDLRKKQCNTAVAGQSASIGAVSQKARIFQQNDDLDIIEEEDARMNTIRQFIPLR